MISIIIPVFNEEKILSANRLRFQALSKRAELIFVDGRSSDNSVKIAEQYGEVYQYKRGRAKQMNHGAGFANSDILLFLHADTFVHQEGLRQVERLLKNDEIIGGCFTQKIAAKGLRFRFIEHFGNTRAKITKVFYGDQGIFVRKSVFLEIDGFPDVPILEDILFSKKLRCCGKVAVLPETILVSSRRWYGRGIFRTCLTHCFINVLFWCGAPLNKIKKIYKDYR